jgi:nickel/cobalt exporter
MKPILALIAALLALVPTLAAAHPLGNFTVNRSSRIEAGADRIALHFVVDMAEIPAFQELSALGATGGLAPEAADRYARRRADELRGQLTLSVDGRPLPLTVERASLALPEGQGGLRTLRLEVDYRAPGRLGALSYQDDSYGDRLGWKEVSLRAAPGAAVADADVPADSPSDELRAYPDAMLQAPLNRRSARARLLPATAQAAGPAVAEAAAAGPVVAGQPPVGSLSFWERARVRASQMGGAALRAVGGPAPEAGAPELVTPATPTAWLAAPAALGWLPGGGSTGETVAALARVELTWPLLLAALAAAAGFGMAHALSPGHGKTVVAAYLVGARGTPWHALLLGLTVTLTHTWGVFALGLLTLYAGQHVDPERLYPWLSLLSGLTVVAMGLSLLRVRLGRARAHDSHHHAAHDHDHGHGHGHHHHDHHGHQHGDRALSHHDHGHGDHGHGHGHAGHGHGDHGHGGHGHGDHGHGGHDHDHGQDDRGRGAGHVHRHGPFSHSHVPSERLGWRGLVMLGVVGGLLPCPSALILMLASIALGRIALGLGLVLAFSLGLAVVLTSIGLLFVYARGLLDRLAASRGAGRATPLALATRLVPVGSAVAVTLAGLAISAGALPAVLGG